MTKGKKYVTVSEDLILGCTGMLQKDKFDIATSFLSPKNKNRLWHEWVYYRFFAASFLIIANLDNRDDINNLSDVFRQVVHTCIDAGQPPFNEWDSLNSNTLDERISSYWEKINDAENQTAFLIELAQYTLFTLSDFQEGQDYSKKDYVTFKMEYFVPEMTTLYKYLCDSVKLCNKSGLSGALLTSPIGTGYRILKSLFSRN